MNDVMTPPLESMRLGGGEPQIKAKNTLGKDDFMKLLMAQMKHQDPLKPMDHHEFASQLAQFGSLEQLTNIGTGIQGLKSGMGDESKLQALSLIGKNVIAKGNEIELLEGQKVSFNPNTPQGRSVSKVTIMDPNGKLIRELNLLGKEASTIEWDGKNEVGERMPAARYQFKIFGISKDGKGEEISSEVTGTVMGVELMGSTPTLIVQSGGGGKTKMDLSKIKEVVASPDVPKVLKNEGEKQVASPQIKELLVPKMALSELNENEGESTEELSNPNESDATQELFEKGFHGFGNFDLTG